MDVDHRLMLSVRVARRSTGELIKILLNSIVVTVDRQISSIQFVIWFGRRRVVIGVRRPKTQFYVETENNAEDNDDHADQPAAQRVKNESIGIFCAKRNEENVDSAKVRNYHEEIHMSEANQGPPFSSRRLRSSRKKK